jgi:hypothetical protein
MYFWCPHWRIEISFGVISDGWQRCIPVVKLHKKIISVLRERWPDVVDALDDVKGTHGVTGVIISKAFDGLSHEARQQRLWKLLNKSLTADEAANVGPIATLTPAEANPNIISNIIST